MMAMAYAESSSSGGVANRGRVGDMHAPLQGFSPLSHVVRGGHHVARLSGGRRVELTLDADLQAHVENILARYEVPEGALFAVEPSTGRVLAYVSHHQTGSHGGKDLVLDASPPAASVFKLVTAAALLDTGVGPSRKTCYSGGSSGIEQHHLSNAALPGQRCTSFADALGLSANAVFAKLAVRHLQPKTLERYANAFGFGHALPFDVPTTRSRFDIPDERLEFARTAAGFWHSRLSPFHGALLAATVANLGMMPKVSMVDRVVGPSGQALQRFAPEGFRQVIPAATARRLTQMMTTTVESGTARGAFFDERGNAFLPGIEVAAKTGSLSDAQPYRAYSWWVGFAPADNPKIALAALVVNSPKWRIKSSYLAREALRKYLIEGQR